MSDAVRATPAMPPGSLRVTLETNNQDAAALLAVLVYACRLPWITREQGAAIQGIARDLRRQLEGANAVLVRIAGDVPVS